MNALFAAMMLALVLLLGGVGHALSRADQLQAAHNANVAQLRLVRAELELMRIVERDIKPANVILVDQLCRDRVEALRDGIRVMLRVGKVEQADFPGMAWRNWE